MVKVDVATDVDFLRKHPYANVEERLRVVHRQVLDTSATVFLELYGQFLDHVLPEGVTRTLRLARIALLEWHYRFSTMYRPSVPEVNAVTLSRTA